MKNPFFPIVTFLGGLFVVTIFALIAGLLGDPEAPIAKLLDRHGGTLLAIEVGAIIVAGLSAMALDRYQTLHGQQPEPPPRDVTDEQDEEDDR